MSGKVSGFAALPEVSPLSRARLTGQACLVEASGSSSVKLAGLATLVEAQPASTVKLTGFAVLMEVYVPEFTPAGPYEYTGRELTGESIVFNRRWTGMRGKKRRGY